jgi:glutathione S-transferase
MEAMKDLRSKTKKSSTRQSRLKKLLRRFETELGEQPYLWATVGDAALIPRFTRLEGFRFCRMPPPRFSKYLQRIRTDRH